VSLAILRGDARTLPLASRSVDLIVTSPPYWALRSYTDTCGICRAAIADGIDPRTQFINPGYDEHVRLHHHYADQIGSEPHPAAYIDTLIECTAEWMRVLKPGGSIWVNLGDKYSDRGHGPSRGRGTSRGPQAETLRQTRGPREKSLLLLPERYRIACVDRLGLIARAVVIWDKPNGLPESVTDRVRRSHEDWVHLVKQRTYFAAVDTIREPYDDKTAARYATGFTRATSSSAGQTRNGVLRADGGGPSTTNPLGKLPGSVRVVPTQPLRVPAELGVDHFAAFPMDWPRWIISGWSPAGGTVLDPFGGTGTTALVADVLGRHGISVDRSADYCRLAAWRTTDPGQRAAAMGVERPAAPMAGQIDLFEAVPAGGAR
jgi:DNA modification methylase